jgi:hypothetical protein
VGCLWTNRPARSYKKLHLNPFHEWASWQLVFYWMAQIIWNIGLGSLVLVQRIGLIGAMKVPHAVMCKPSRRHGCLTSQLLGMTTTAVSRWISIISIKDCKFHLWKEDQKFVIPNSSLLRELLFKKVTWFDKYLNAACLPTSSSLHKRSANMRNISVRKPE